MQSVLLQSKIETREALIAELWEVGTTGVIENPDSVQAFFDTEVKVSLVLSRFSHLVLELTDERPFSALAATSKNHDPVYAGDSFFIVSSGISSPTPPGRRRLTIDAKNAFGSGSHESTQLVIQALEQYLVAGATVLDVGCGSGVLSQVAQELGAGRVFACDTHIGALDSARQHSRKSHLFAGSIDSVKDSLADIVLVNISARMIDLLAGELHRVTKPGGMLILAGFINDRTPTNMDPRKVFSLNDWACWLCHPESIKRGSYPLKAALQPFPEQWW